MAAETRNPNAGPLVADDLPIPAPSRWDNVPACTCHNRWPGCTGNCEVCPESKGPAWFQFTERHPLLIALAAVAFGMAPYFWGGA